jgi:putative nucleotidyltransferase with HDIG domain
MESVTIDNKVKLVVANIRNLPTPPIVFHQIQQVTSDPDSSAGQVAAVLAEDPAMSVKVLKLTNSAFYGLAREIESVKQAVMIVGMEAIKNLVLSASVLDMFKGNNIDQESQESFWRHSLAAAFCGRMLARKVTGAGSVDPDTAFSSGLLHDVGKMVIACFLSDESAELAKARQADRETEDYQLEERVLGFNHAQIGAYLAEQWKLPRRLIDSIRFHHHPDRCEDETPLAQLVHLADHVAKRTFYDRYQDGHLIGSLHPSVTEQMQLSDEELEEFCSVLRDEYVKAETFMRMAGIAA